LRKRSIDRRKLDALLRGEKEVRRVSNDYHPNTPRLLHGHFPFRLLCAQKTVIFGLMNTIWHNQSTRFISVM
jgi:hypothetical protein